MRIRYERQQDQSVMERILLDAEDVRCLVSGKAIIFGCVVLSYDFEQSPNPYHELKEEGKCLLCGPL